MHLFRSAKPFIFLKLNRKIEIYPFAKKNGAALLISNLSRFTADLLRQFFPEMAIFTFNTRLLLEGIKKSDSNKSIGRVSVSDIAGKNGVRICD
jgi:hypothetical protein